jgi:helicase
MKLEEMELPPGVADILKEEGITSLYPPQEQAVPMALKGKNIFMAVPTASGKSLVAYLAALKHILERGGKALYIVPLRALASEKFEDLRRFEPLGVRVGVSVGDFDSPDPELERYDIIVATSEKADSLLRHRSSWLQKISLVVADEVHLIHDPERGPTLEVTLTKFRRFNPELQVIALSATVKNSKELASWLDAEHISSEWRPTPLKEGVYVEGEIHFTDNSKRRVEDHGDGLAWSAIRSGGWAGIGLREHSPFHRVPHENGAPDEEVMPEKVKLEKEEELLQDHGEPTSIGKKLRSCVHKGVASQCWLTNEQRRWWRRPSRPEGSGHRCHPHTGGRD